MAQGGPLKFSNSHWTDKSSNLTYSAKPSDTESEASAEHTHNPTMASLISSHVIQLWKTPFTYVSKAQQANHKDPHTHTPLHACNHTNKTRRKSVGRRTAATTRTHIPGLLQSPRRHPGLQQVYHFPRSMPCHAMQSIGAYAFSLGKVDRTHKR
jgi:hypothetical protein